MVTDHEMRVEALRLSEENDKLQKLRTHAQRAPDREQIARIINPDLFVEYDLLVEKGTLAENGKPWSWVVFDTRIERLLAKADAILALSAVTSTPSEPAQRAPIKSEAELVKTEIASAQEQDAAISASEVEFMDELRRRQMSEREEWVNLIRNEYDPKPNLGRANYPAFDDEWDDGAGRIADAILADKTNLLRRQAIECDEFLNSHRQQVAELLAEIERLRACADRCGDSQ